MSNKNVISGKSKCEVPLLDEARVTKRYKDQDTPLYNILADSYSKPAVQNPDPPFGVSRIAMACAGGDYSRLFEALYYLVPQKDQNDDRLLRAFDGTNSFPHDTAILKLAVCTAKEMTEEAIQHELDTRGNVSSALELAAVIVQAIQIIAAEKEEAELLDAKNSSRRRSQKEKN